ncbi:uncharacterized protein LOC106868886 isoform X2 [Octopus bimaculoides]|uniref:uncharacterized protein LOC106868886 isoform X2 n=1 Tax=Octopus bimaculoides TaxID=37653 RepID=UPI00071C3502|nr:uncharacterized protein LOC106868886 isoform X2 [Octopus bimaculoides]|eukprot:XP_014769826.1 PREDICTED: uncharacterized protein LOC106868886 isoform X1 [Octopus bimaculoides]
MENRNSMNFIDAAMLFNSHQHRMDPHYKKMLFLTLLSLLLLSECESMSVKEYSSLPENLKTKDKDDNHGGIKMGVVSKFCDDGKVYLDVDLKDSTIGYKCEYDINHANQVPFYEVSSDEEEDPPIHVCLPENITYDKDIPTSGSHRPLWPIYGGYKYLPPQRWLHSLEHGAAVFLYHPCADKVNISYFKRIAFGCLKKIIVTPSSKVPKSRPFVVVVYKKKLLMNTVQEDVITKFLETNDWFVAPEHNVWTDGIYSLDLQKSSYNNSLLQDNYKNICLENLLNNYKDMVENIALT